MKEAVEVAAALVQDAEGRYLLSRRPRGHLAGRWEFPGGKREPGETLEACLRRELAEELGADFEVGERVETIRWEYPERTVLLHFFRCRLRAGTIEARERQALAWVAPAGLDDLDLPDADRALIARLRR